MPTRATDAGAPALSVTCIEDRTQLSALEAEWETLLDRADVASPFLTPAWQFAWLDTYGAGRRLFVLVARRGGELVGLWALAIRRRGIFRVLEPLGAGRSDWLDILTVPADRRAVTAAFGEWLSVASARWDLIDMRDVLAESPTISALERLASDSPLRLRQSARTVAPYAALNGNWAVTSPDGPAIFSSSVKRRLKNLGDGAGQLSVKMEMAPSPETIVRILAEVEQKSWKAQDGNRKLTTAVGSAFYRAFIGAFGTRGVLRIWTAVVDQRVVAYPDSLHLQGECFYYNGSYVEEAANLSPGTVLHAYAIQDAFNAGLSELRFSVWRRAVQGPMEHGEARDTSSGSR